MDKKSLQLGMSFSTAQNRLTRNLLFYYIGVSGKDRCFRCSQPMNERTYSIDHRKDWLDDDPTLFWDIRNIEFSHQTCNYKAGRKVGGIGRRKDSGPADTSWCADCKEYKPISEFYLDNSRWNGYRRLCKDCFNRERGRIV